MQAQVSEAALLQDVSWALGSSALVHGSFGRVPLMRAAVMRYGC